MSDWVKHDGGHCPVDPNANVAIRFRDGWEDADMNAAYWMYSEGDRDYWISDSADSNNDIVAYRVLE